RGPRTRAVADDGRRACPDRAASMSARPDRALFHAATSLGFPRLPIRPAVFVIAGREAWERFTTNGTDEDLAAARIAVAARLTEKAHRGAASVTPPSGQADPRPDAEKAYRR